MALLGSVPAFVPRGYGSPNTSVKAADIWRRNRRIVSWSFWTRAALHALLTKCH